MWQEIREIKKMASDIELYGYRNDTEELLKLLDSIIDMSKRLKKEINIDMGTVEERVEDICYKGDFNYITEIPFIYKPITKQDYYDGDYLHFFGKNRTEELNRAGVLDVHNRFWTANNVENGNIFGSIPVELISNDNKKILLESGWKEVNVHIYDVNNDLPIEEINEMAYKEFDYYLVITEQKDDQALILEYKI
ncbi:hypothetical protein [Clostridiisalibacter paucivorans]|uniref:hypothetical protein n=1 Tax=Clostridiisalibacter paucivorans TaxID=408753 RepID=UPI00047B5859|nr:hypothetical protein [Clostridiisalibacter paucivorans]